MKTFSIPFRLIDYFFLIVTDPRKLTALIAREEKAALPMAIMNIALVSVMDILALSLLGRPTSYFYYRITYGWILNFILLVLFVLIFAALVDTTCQYFGYPGRVKQMINLVSFSLFPRAFLLPGVYIFKVFNFAPLFFYIVLNLATLLWSAIIIIQSISEMHSSGIGRSLAILIIPPVFIGLLGLFAAILFIINISGLISTL